MKSDIQALERALEGFTTTRSGGLMANEDQWSDFHAIANPTIVRRLLDERAKMLELLERSANALDEYWCGPFLDELSAFLKEAQS